MNQFNQRSIVTGGYWLSTFCEGASRILIPIYLNSIGISAAKIGILFFSYELFGLIANFLGGLFINRVGYKKAYILSLIFHTIASLGYLFIFKGPLIVTIIGINALRAFRGIGKELIKTTSSAYYRQLANNHLQTHILLGGKDSIKGIGLLSGSILLTYLTFQQSFFILGIATLALTLICSLSLDDFQEKVTSSFGQLAKVNTNLVILAFVRAFLYAGRDLWLVIPLPLFLVTAGVSKIYVGTILAIGLIIFGIVQPLTGLFVKSQWHWKSIHLKSKWYYEDIIPFVSFILCLIPLAMNSMTHQPWLLLIGVGSYNILAGLATSPHNYLHIRLARKDHASLDIATYKTISQFGKITAVSISGLLYGLYGLEGCLMASSSCLFISGLIGIILSNSVHHMKRRKLAELPSKK